MLHRTAGLDNGKYASHPLRPDPATNATAQGVEERIIARTTRHNSFTVFRTFVWDGEPSLGNNTGHVEMRGTHASRAADLLFSVHLRGGFHNYLRLICLDQRSLAAA